MQVLAIAQSRVNALIHKFVTCFYGRLPYIYIIWEFSWRYEWNINGILFGIPRCHHGHGRPLGNPPTRWSMAGAWFCDKPMVSPSLLLCENALFFMFCFYSQTISNPNVWWFHWIQIIVSFGAQGDLFIGGLFGDAGQKFPCTHQNHHKYCKYPLEIHPKGSDPSSSYKNHGVLQKAYKMNGC